MDRREFVEELRRALSGNMRAQTVDRHVSYYDEYIDMQLKKGMTEAEILEFLGSPRLLAKSIIAMEEAAGGRRTAAGNGATDTASNVEFEEGSDGTSSGKGGFLRRLKNLMGAKTNGATVFVLGLLSVVTVIVLGIVSVLLVGIMIPVVLIFMAIFLLIYVLRHR